MSHSIFRFGGRSFGSDRARFSPRHARSHVYAIAFALGLGAFTADARAGENSEDECSKALSISGEGQFFYQTAGATPSPEPETPGCDFGQPMDADVWFCWNAPCTGQVLISFWDQGPQPKFAIYDGCECPPDDANALACGFTQASFPVEVESNYLIRIGGLSYPDQFGSFTMQCVGDGSVGCKVAQSCQEPDQLGHGSGNATGYTSSTFGYAFDDFVTTSGASLTSVCWWGHYFDFTSGDCEPTALGPESFLVTYYNDDAKGDIPGSLRAGPFEVFPSAFGTGNELLTGNGPVTEYQYEAFHPAVAVAPAGECLWISIRNTVYDGPCYWVWASAPGGDLRAAFNDTKFLFPLDLDFAFCIDQEIHPYGCDQLVPPANDDCANAIDISAEGVVKYDTSLATTDGPDHVSCMSFGQPGIRDDLWYCWTAPASGEIVVSTCSLGDTDTSVAVYARCECPVTDFDLITCDDDFCGLQSSVTVTVLEGLDYLIRVGTWPLVPGGPGAFDVQYTIIELPAPQEFPAEGESIIEDVGDLENDGDVDVVVAIPDQDPGRPGEIQVFLNNGNDVDGDWLGLTPQPALGVGLDPSGVAIGHYNEDDYLDVAVTNSGDDTVSIFLNNATGDGSISFAFFINTSKDPSAIAAADFTNDGLVDLAVASEFDNEVTIFQQNPAPPLGPGGGFDQGETIPSAGEAPVALEPEDVDNDKDVDLIILNKGPGGGANGSSTTVQFQNGSSAGVATSPTGAEPGDVTSGLIDGDFLPDTAVSNRGGGTVTVFFSDDGLLGPTTIDVGDDPRSIKAVDLDGDGDADLVIAANDEVIGPAVQVIANLHEGGGPAFGPPVGFSVNADPNFVASADFDNDGTFDIVTANADSGETGGSVTVLLNSPPRGPCGGDFGGDGYIGFGDMVDVLLAWGPCEDVKCPFDVNGDGEVGFGDLKEILIFWGDCRPE